MDDHVGGNAQPNGQCTTKIGDFTFLFVHYIGFSWNGHSNHCTAPQGLFACIDPHVFAYERPCSFRIEKYLIEIDVL